MTEWTPRQWTRGRGGHRDGDAVPGAARAGDSSSHNYLSTLFSLTPKTNPVYCPPVGLQTWTLLIVLAWGATAQDPTKAATSAQDRAAHSEIYCFGFLNSHPERKEIPEAEGAEIQKGHIAHLTRMGREGHLLAAGPLMTPGGARGIVIYRCESLDQVREWTAQDPAVRNKRLVLEVYRWMGPQGMGMPNPDTKYEMVRLPLIVMRKTDKWTAGPPEAIPLAKEGTLRAAGPFVDGDGKTGTIPGLVGVFVFKAMPLEEAVAIANKDPMVREGYVRVDGYEWFVADEAIPNPAAH